MPGSRDTSGVSGRKLQRPSGRKEKKNIDIYIYTLKGLVITYHTRGRGGGGGGVGVGGSRSYCDKLW